MRGTPPFWEPAFISLCFEEDALDNLGAGLDELGTRPFLIIGLCAGGRLSAGVRLPRREKLAANDAAELRLELGGHLLDDFIGALLALGVIRADAAELETGKHGHTGDDTADLAHTSDTAAEATREAHRRLGVDAKQIRIGSHDGLRTSRTGVEQLHGSLTSD